MALTPTEREEHFFKAMVDAASGKTPEELEPTERKEHWYKEIIDAIKSGGGGSGGGGVLVVTQTAGTLDKTWNEIVTAMTTTGAVLAHYYDGSIDNLVTFKNASGDEEFGEYLVSTGTGINGTYVASSPSGYPVRQSE